MDRNDEASVADRMDIQQKEITFALCVCVRPTFKEKNTVYSIQVFLRRFCIKKMVSLVHFPLTSRQILLNMVLL